MCNKTVLDLKKEGAPIDLAVILESKWSLQYEASRKISNSKFDYRPSAIAYCNCANHVQFCVNYCRENDIEFRIRSGGHQHEGMCSGNNILIIDLSELHDIEYIQYMDEAWIPVGKKLTNVYQELEAKGYIIPGGGCASVNVGGLTQGGGWGVSIRKLGFTCDNILEAEIVLANGQVVYASPTNFPDLFWGLKGGGGGNFGIVTRFRFKLTKLETPMTYFSLFWNREDDAIEGITKWMKMQRDLEKNKDLSTYCRMSIESACKGKGSKKRINTILARMGGLYYGKEEELRAILLKYFGELGPPKKNVEGGRSTYKSDTKYFGPAIPLPLNRNCKDIAKGIIMSKVKPGVEEEDLTDDFHEFSIADAQNYVAQVLTPFGSLDSLFGNSNEPKVKITCKPRKVELPKAPAITCDAPHPHKVTSTFPKDVKNKKEAAKLDKEIATKIFDYLSEFCYYPDVDRYMSFHCMGGAVTDNPTQRAFPYYDKPYMLQAQCWWSLAAEGGENAKRKKEFDKWIECFREELKGDIEGSFINFVDKDICGPYKPSLRQAILTQYYTKKNLIKLIAVKNRYDPYNLFNFRLSIPLEYKEEELC